jgi:glutamate-1-semialdehyde 2,1-aminomutase
MDRRGDRKDLGMTGKQFTERAHAVIPGGAHTFSRGDDQFPEEWPRGFVRGKGARVWDLDGREYVDWGMGINNVLIGHAEDAIDDAAITALRGGQAFSRPSPLEVEAAEMLVDIFPGLAMAKFGKNGSDANTGAVRLARAITGRTLVAYDASAPFLSIHDWFIGRTVMSAGIPDDIRRLTVPFELNDTASVERVFAEHPRALAAVVLEVARDAAPAPGFMQTLRRLCDEHGTLLVFDEIVTGFRCGRYALYPDLAVVPDFLSIGKGMANGYALSALLGRREYMERGGIRHDGERVFFLSTTNGPERSALAACLATVEFYRTHDVVGHLARTGRRLMEGLASAAARHRIADYVSASGAFPARPFLRFLDSGKQVSMAFRTLFLQELGRAGVFMPWICPSYRHGDAEIGRTLEAFDAACAVYARALENGSVNGLLVGAPTKPVFRRYN